MDDDFVQFEYTSLDTAVKKIQVSDDEINSLTLTGGSGRGWSRYSTLQRCALAFYYSYVMVDEGVIHSDSSALAIGGGLHAHLAVYYSLGLEKARWFNSQLLNGGLDPLVFEEVTRLFYAYVDNYGNKDYLRPIAIELRAEDPETRDTCRYDLLAKIDDPPLNVLPGLWVIEHKCLAGDARVFDFGKNRYFTVKELFDNKQRACLLSFDERRRKLCRVVIDTPTLNTLEDVYEVSSRSGRSIPCSANHPFFTQRGWVRADELLTTDWVAVPNQTSSGTYASLDDATVKFLGYMLGNGSLGERPNFSMTPGPTFDDFVKACREADFPVRVDHAKNSTAARASLTAKARDFFKHLGLFKHRGPDKFVPPQLSFTIDQVRLLIESLWNTDGCVRIFREGTNVKVDITFTSRSKQLVLEVQALLLRLGIDSSIANNKVLYKDVWLPYWQVSVIGRAHKKLFLDTIKFIKYSTDEAKTLIKSGNDDYVPIELVFPNRKATRKRRSLARWVVERDHAVSCKKILELPIIWDRVKSVNKRLARELTYNIEVPGTHTLCVNDIITHNTAQRFDDSTLDGWDIDGEILGEYALFYKAGLDKTYGPLRGVCVNLIGKQKEPKFDRIWVEPSQFQIDKHLDDLKYFKDYEYNLLKIGKYPRSLANCIHRYGKCPYYDHCRSK